MRTLRTIGLTLASAIALGVTASAWALGGTSSTPMKANVKVVKEDFFVANNTVRSSIAKCPNGTKVFSGGFASTGQHARVNVAGPSRGENGYVVWAYTPPVNINTGVGKEIAKITIVAYCAPVGQPVVLG